MSLSKVAQKCSFCNIGKGIYSCPRCNRKYCTTQCYKSREHESCSESFYREWVESSLQTNAFNRTERENMFQILKRCADASVEDSVEDEPSLEERFETLNINNADESVIWNNLSKEEKKNFKAFIEDEGNLETIIPLKQPWWTITMLNLVVDAEKPDLQDDLSVRPPFPLNTKKLSDLTLAKPSDCVQYNLITILYSYAFLYRFYNCDLRDFMEDVVDSIFTLTPVLSEGRNYFSLEESVQDSIRLISNSEFNVPLAFVKSIVNDVSSIMQGPKNSKSYTFVLCVLHDIKLLFLELKYTYHEKSAVDKTFKKRLMLAVKKLEYFMSWCSDFEKNLSDIASELVLLMLPELFSDSESSEVEDKVFHDAAKEKPLIEEID